LALTLRSSRKADAGGVPSAWFSRRWGGGQGTAHPPQNTTHASANAQEIVTLEEALARAAAAEPGLAAAAAGVEAARAGVDQASVRLNPSLSVEAENFGGTGPLSGADSIETTATYEQIWQRGGDRRARIGVAEGDLALARGDAVLRRLDLLRDVQEAYVDAAAAAARRDLAVDRLAIADGVRSTVAGRVSRALDPSVALARAELELETARAEVDAAGAAADAARMRLASFWSDLSAAFTVDLEGFYDPGAHAQEIDELLDDGSPDLALIQAARGRAAAVVDLEVARGVQDVELGAGLRHANDTGDVAVVAEVSIPLALFDRNRGAVAAARAERTRLAYEEASARRSILRDIASLQRMRASAIARVDALRERVIPLAERALQEARDGYARGGFSSLEVNDAQRALHDARESLVDALADYHLADAALDRLTARFAAPLPGEGDRP
jgi:cobalt-zinc-cadmium efflux system outer membrane protein